MALERQPDDSALVARIARGDEAALARLYDRYAAVVNGLALRMLGTREEAEEVVIETFSQAWSRATSYEGGRGRVDTWLLVIARSRALDRLRARERAARLSTALEAQMSLEGPRAVPDPEESALLAERQRAVREALEALSPQHRDALELVYYEGLSHSEISARTGEPLGTVKTRIRAGLSKLRTLLSAG